MTRGSAFSVAVVCEAEADQRIACDLAERVLLEEVDWLEPETIGAVVRWRGYDPAVKFLTWKKIYAEAHRRGLRRHGAFRQSPGAYDESRTRLALRLFLDLEDTPDAVLLVRDTDNQEERIQSLILVRDSPAWTFEVILATPHPKRECWVLAGFDPKDSTEIKALDAVVDGARPRFRVPGALRVRLLLGLVRHRVPDESADADRRRLAGGIGRRSLPYEEEAQKLVSQRASAS